MRGGAGSAAPSRPSTRGRWQQQKKHRGVQRFWIEIRPTWVGARPRIRRTAEVDGMNSRRDATENDLRSLLLQGLNGSSPAYREFLLKLSQLLRAYVRRQFDRLQKSANDAEDVVQEALLAIHNRRHTYEPDLPVTAWAYAITRYKLIDHLRANNHELQAIPLEEVDSVIDTRDQVEAKIAVQSVMAELPDTLRLPIKLVKLEGYSAKEAARRTGTSEATVRVNVHRGLKALARLCGVKQGSPDEN